MAHKKRLIALSLVIAGAWLSPACGGDSESDDSGGGGKKDAGNDGTIGGGTGGGTGATGGTSGSGGGGGCDPVDCPGLGGIVSGCCLPDDSCGYDGSVIGLGCVSQEDIGGLLEGGLDASVPDGAADPNCDDFQIAGFNLEGCCLPSGFCGWYVPFILNSCVDPADLPPQIPVPDTGPPQACGDGGTSTDAGDSSTPPLDSSSGG